MSGPKDMDWQVDNEIQRRIEEGMELERKRKEEEIKAIVVQTMQETGASSKADMGKLMGALMPKVKGVADGKVVNGIVQQLLQ